MLLVENNGETKAFPLQWLHETELVMDAIGGEDLLVTYCGLTYSPAVYKSDRAITVNNLTDSGYVHESNLVLLDRRTSSLWLQITGECLAGFGAGTRLSEHPSFLAIFRDIKAAVPGALVMLRPVHWSAARPREPLFPNEVPILHTPWPGFQVTCLYPILSPKERVLGFEADGYQLAIPIDRVPAGSTTNTLGRVHWRMAPYLGFPAVETSVDGAEWTRASARVCYWFAWFVTHRNTAVYKPAATPESLR